MYIAEHVTLLLLDVCIEEERLYGSLHVTINKLQGLTKPQCKWLHLPIIVLLLSPVICNHVVFLIF